MHELALTESIVEICTQRAQGASVKRVTLEVGQLAAVIPDAIRFCFDVCTAGTALEGAVLEIIDVPGRGRCTSCAVESAMPSYLSACSCGAGALKCIAGERLRVKTMEIH